MNSIILLETGPLGLITAPKLSSLANDCKRWFQTLIANGKQIVIPEIADYEVRRELLRANKLKGIARLDHFISTVECLPLTTAMHQAAQFWAEARQQGRPTAGDKNIDGDVILAAQAVTLGLADFVIATTNIKHLARFAPAELWQSIS